MKSTTVGSKVHVGVVGGAGQIGTDLAIALEGSYEFTLYDLPERFTDQHAQRWRCVPVDVTQPSTLIGQFRGLDALIHLAGARSPKTDWNTALSVNIQGTYNVLTEAASSSCRRVIYASSVEAVRGHPDDGIPIKESDRPIPNNLYGVSKAAGEALTAYFAAEGCFEAASLRIGAYQQPEVLRSPENAWMLDIYCAPADLASLVAKVLETPRLGNTLFSAISNNERKRLSIDRGRDIGYAPQHDSFSLRDATS